LPNFLWKFSLKIWPLLGFFPSENLALFYLLMANFGLFKLKPGNPGPNVVGSGQNVKTLGVVQKWRHTYVDTIFCLTSCCVHRHDNRVELMTNRNFSQIGHFSTQIDPVITNPGFINKNEWSRAVCYYRVWLYILIYCLSIDLTVRCYNEYY
jgi:hypothetical protein